MKKCLKLFWAKIDEDEAECCCLVAAGPWRSLAKVKWRFTVGWERNQGGQLYSRPTTTNYIQIDGNANTMGNFSEQDLTGFHDINIAWHLAEEEVGTSKGFATTLGFKFSIQFNFSHLPYNIPLLKVQCFVTFLNWNELLWAVNMKYQPLIAHCAALGVGVTSDWQKAVLFEHSVTYCLLLYENTELRYELHREIGIFVFNYY